MVSNFDQQATDDFSVYTDDHYKTFQRREYQYIGSKDAGTTAQKNNTMCPLCASDDDEGRRLSSTLTFMILLGMFFLAFVCVWCNKKCRRWRRSRDQDNVIVDARRPTQGVGVPRGDSDGSGDDDLDVSRQLGRMRRMQIVTGSLITTKVVKANVLHLSTSSVDLVSQNRGKHEDKNQGDEEDPLGRTGHTLNTDDSLERTEHSMEGSDDPSSTTADGKESTLVDHDDVSTEPMCWKQNRRCTMITETSSCASSIGDEEEGMQSKAQDDDDCNDLDLETNNSSNSTLILESTRWEIDTCAICIESYQEKDLVSYSKKGNCGHVFHKKCIELWLRDKDDCPCCRCPYI